MTQPHTWTNIVSAAALVAALLGGCGGGCQPANPPRQPATGAELAAQVQAAIAAEPALRDQQIRVRYGNDAVVLEGTVQTPEQRSLAGRVATAVPGVPQTINLLEVAADPVAETQTLTPPTQRPDAEILAAVQTAWKDRRAHEACDVRLFVKDRKVTATGWAPAAEELDQLRLAAESIAGVEGVDISGVFVDTQIAAAIDTALDQFQEGMLLDRKVRVELGRVTLDGRGTAGGVRDTADELVRAVPGVRPPITNRINEDAALGAAIKKALDENESLAEYARSWGCSVADGKATFTGWISSEEGRELMRQIALRVRGIKSADVSKVEIKAAP